MKRVAIIEGWAGGKWHTKNFSEALKTAGFEVVSSRENTDVVIAHSVGCYNLPRTTEATMVMLINPPYWPGKSPLKRLVARARNDTKSIIRDWGLPYYLKKLSWSFIYFLRKPSYTWIGLTSQRRLDFLNNPNGSRKMILIRNKGDYYCSPGIESVAKAYPWVKFTQLPGGHDDYYTNPKPYIDTLTREL